MNFCIKKSSQGWLNCWKMWQQFSSLPVDISSNRIVSNKTYIEKMHYVNNVQ